MNQKIILTLVAVFALIGISTLVAAFVIVDSPATEFQNDNIDSITNVDSTTSEINSKIIDVDSITIGFIPVEKADELTPKAEVLEKFLESELGIDVKIVVPTNYETIIEGMRFGHIDAAFMDTGPAWITHQRTGAEAVLAEIVEGKVNYQATVWTLAENDSINTLEDTVGKRVAFTSITGSSGFVRPMGTLVTEGYIDIEGDDIVALEQALANNFESYTFAGGYKAALNLLLNGDVDVAFGSDIAPQKYLDLEDQLKLRPVVTIGPVPSHVFMVSSSMSDSTKDNLVSALIKLNYDENNFILTDLYGAEALVPTTTTMHIGEFGTFIDVLTGLDQKILDNGNKSK
ncbi:MAG TPA: phosphate/phosphite/phosphonate ABC transporter substrate-binding protein [Nitrosopumilus sp.]|jgi:phosphonate transport system substrate-binding protein|nr:phosphate/phosphite/phosphonate ABC transporter substrate-binding protein [Nitrosopumilus sp.]HII05454.1 phosphate/phosphite/phosphonate ABC transporter substrate-binding protein [Nitrosopumilus sp.]